MSVRLHRTPATTPGPLDYNTGVLISKLRAPTFSLGARSKSTHQLLAAHNNFTPAPGTYQSPTEFKVKHGGFVGSSLRKDLTQTEKTPAPNHYATNSTRKSSPAFGMGQQRKQLKFSKGETTPGPCGYEKSSFVDENSHKRKGFSLRQKAVDLAAQQSSKRPGPGQYDAHLRLKTTGPRCAATHTPRMTFMDQFSANSSKFPGPGSHDPALKSTARVGSFGKSNRKPLDERQRTPGPFAYTNSLMMQTAPCFSAGKARDRTPTQGGGNPETPGPGQYMLEMKKGVSHEIPHENRPDFNHQSQLPGPGYYNLRTELDRANWKFGTEQRLAFTERQKQAFGGRHYDIPNKVVDPPSYMNTHSKLKFLESTH